ncbi:LysR substrate binding domain protein [compost metagenome]
MLREAAVAGVGVVHVPLVVVRDELDSGQLVRVTPDWAPECGVLHAVFASRRGLLPGVRSLLDFLAKEFEVSDIT